MQNLQPAVQADKLAAAQFNVVHLIAAVAKLRPGWLPRPLFELLHQRWLSPERRARCARPAARAGGAACARARQRPASRGGARARRARALRRAANEEALPRPALLETKRLAKALVSYIAAHHGELPALFDLLQAFTLRTAADLTFLRAFLCDAVAATFSLAEKQAVRAAAARAPWAAWPALCSDASARPAAPAPRPARGTPAPAAGTADPRASSTGAAGASLSAAPGGSGRGAAARAQVVRFLLDAFRAASRPQEELVQAVRLLVLPMLEASYAAGQAVVDEAMLQAMVADMFDPPDELAGARPPGPAAAAAALPERAPACA